MGANQGMTQLTSSLPEVTDPQTKSFLTFKKNNGETWLVQCNLFHIPRVQCKTRIN